MLLDWYHQHCENDHTTKRNLHVQCNPYQYPKNFLQRDRKSILKFTWKHKRPRIAKSILIKMSNAGGITTFNFKWYYRVITVKTAWYWHKNRHENQWIRIEDPDINPSSYSQLIFDKGAQNTQWRKVSLSNKHCWKNWISTCRRLKLDLCPSFCAKINLKQINNL
jgi:hypothetical protein